MMPFAESPTIHKKIKAPQPENSLPSVSGLPAPLSLILTKNKHIEIATNQMDKLLPPNAAPMASPSAPQKYGV